MSGTQEWMRGIWRFCSRMSRLDITAIVIAAAGTLLALADAHGGYFSFLKFLDSRCHLSCRSRHRLVPQIPALEPAEPLDYRLPVHSGRSDSSHCHSCGAGRAHRLFAARRLSAL